MSSTKTCVIGARRFSGTLQLSDLSEMHFVIKNKVDLIGGFLKTFLKFKMQGNLAIYFPHFLHLVTVTTHVDHHISCYKYN